MIRCAPLMSFGLIELNPMGQIKSGISGWTYKTSLVMTETGGKWPYFEDVTADFNYIRLHGNSRLYQSGYDDRSLDYWCRRIKTWKEGGETFDRVTISDDLAAKKPRDVFVYFDNDAKVHAPWDAKKIDEKVK